MCLATRGSSSEIRIPGTLVEMGLKELLGLGSQVSTWLGPPSSQSRMQAWAFPLGAVPPASTVRRAWRNWLRWIPSRLSEPTRRKWRRGKRGFSSF